MQPRFYMVLYMISTPGYWIIGALPWVALPLTQQKKFHRYIKLKVSRVYYVSFIPFWTITLGTFPRTSPVPNLSSSQKHRIDPRIQNLAVGGLACKCHISVLFFFRTKNNTGGGANEWIYPVFAIHTPVTIDKGVRWPWILESDMRVANYNDLSRRERSP